MAPLRILHVTPYFADAWAYGGIPRVVSTLARGLARRGHQVTVCTTDARDQHTRTGTGAARTADGVAVHVFPNISNALAYHLQFFLPLGFTQFLRRSARSFDVAHIHACRNLPGAIAALHLASAGVPYVVAPNGTAAIIERRRFAKRVFDLVLGQRMLTGAARFIAVSDAERRQLESMALAPGAVRVVPNPIDVDEFRQPIERGRFRRRFSLGDGPIVLFLGKLTPRKRVDVLMRAVRTLPPAVKLVVAGNDMGAGSALRALARELGIADRTVFTGLLEGPARLESLADADVVAYASEDEIFGLVAVEALLAGTPVVVADDSGCGEVVRAVGGGEVVPVGDAAALAAALANTLAQRSAGWRVSDEVAARIATLYGGDAVCTQLERVYADVLKAA